MAAFTVGWSFNRTGKDHWRLMPPDWVGGKPVYLPSTPGRGSAVKNARDELAERGVPFAKLPKSKARQPQHDRKVELDLPKGFDGQRFARALKTYREAQELSQAQLAKQLGITQTLVSTLERMVQRPNTELLVKIQQGLGWDDYYGSIRPAPELEPAADIAPPIEEPAPAKEEPAPLPVPPVEPLDIISKRAKPAPRTDEDEGEGYLIAMRGVSRMMKQMTELRKELREIKEENRELRERNQELEEQLHSRRRRPAAVA